MSTLRISDAPLLPDVDGTEKIPTGGRGDYAISVDQIKGHIFQDVGKELVGLGNVDNTSDLDKPVSTAQQVALNLKADKTYVDTNLDLKADKTNVYTRSETTLALSNKADLVNGVVPENQIPSSFNDVLEFTTPTLPIVGESGKIYVTTDNNKTWRWGGNKYVEISGWNPDSVSKVVTLPTYYTKEAGVDPVTGIVDGAYFNVRSSSDDSYVDEYQNIGGSAVATGKSYPSGSYVETIAKHTALSFKAGKSYALYERVQLATGDIVKSTIEGNTNDPNVDMTGWVNDSDPTVVNSFIELSSLTKRQGRIVYFADRGTYICDNNVWCKESLIDIPVERWEYLVDKPSSDESTWNWSPAFKAAFEYCMKYEPWGDDTRYSSIAINLSSKRYYLKDMVEIDRSNIFLTGQQKLVIRADDATLYNNLSSTSDHMFWFKGLMLDMQGLTFTRTSSAVGLHVKLGDENILNSAAVKGYMGRCSFLSQAKAITLGQAYDIVFDRILMAGFRNNGADTTHCTAIHLLSHKYDNCNSLVFIRPQFETAYTRNYTAIKIDAPQVTTQKHHNIKFVSGHIETHWFGSSFLSISGCLNVEFEGVVFTENGANTDYDITTDKLVTFGSNLTNVSFRNCILQSLMRLTSYNPATDLPMMNFAGDFNGRPGISFKDSYFVGRAVAASGENFDAIIDPNFIDCVSIEDCRFNDFRRQISYKTQLMTGTTTSSNKFALKNSNVGTTLSWYFDDSQIVDKNTFTASKVIATLSSTGKYSAKALETTTGVIQSVDGKFVLKSPNRVDINLNNIESYSFISTGFYPSTPVSLGMNSVRWSAIYSNTWRIQPNAILPEASAVNNIGSSSLAINNIYLQNAPTVVSDENYKSNIRAIDDELLDAWGILDFKMWQMNAAIEEKGVENARWHTGLIAQQVKDALTNAGLDWTKYGLITYESWEASDAVYDDSGMLIEDTKPSGEIYMLRMEECFAVESAYQRRRLDRIEAALNL